MSKASEYGALVGEYVTDYAGTLLNWVANAEEEDVNLADLIANLLHWAEREGFIGGTGDSYNEADEIVASALRHYEAERGDGDDIARDSADHYEHLMVELTARATSHRGQPPPVFEVFQYDTQWYGVRDGHRTGFGYHERDDACCSARIGVIGYYAPPDVPPPDQREKA